VYHRVVIRSFADAGTSDIYDGTDSRPARRIPKPVWPVVRRKLDYLAVARELRDLANVPGNRLEALKGDQLGRCSIRVNQQYRVTFRFENGDAHDVRCEDYHL
jgi:proteic killer suppression protein